MRKNRNVAAALVLAILLIAFAPVVRASDAPPYTTAEYAILARGEISDEAYVGGGLLGTFFGLGLGHIAQGRYAEKGWIFTLGQAAGISMFASGALACALDGIGRDVRSQPANPTCQDGWYVAGLGILSGFKVWEIVDLWAVPPAHNRRFRELKGRGASATPTFAASLFLEPRFDSELGATAGLRVRW